MKSALPIYAIGAVAIIFVLSSKKTASKASGTGTGTGGIGTLPGKETDPTKPSPKKPLGGLTSFPTDQTEPGECNPQIAYYDVKTKKCIQFWKPGETDIAVEKELNNVVQNMTANQNLTMTDICENQEELNMYAVNIIKEVIYQLWHIPKDMLPPHEASFNKPASEPWVFRIWKNVTDIYIAKVCDIIPFNPYA